MILDERSAKKCPNGIFLSEMQICITPPRKMGFSETPPPTRQIGCEAIIDIWALRLNFSLSYFQFISNYYFQSIFIAQSIDYFPGGTRSKPDKASWFLPRMPPNKRQFWKRYIHRRIYDRALVNRSHHLSSRRWLTEAQAKSKAPLQSARVVGYLQTRSDFHMHLYRNYA